MNDLDSKVTGSIDSLLSCTFHDSTAVVEMNHGKVNVMDLEFCKAWVRLFDDLNRSNDCRAVVLTSKGRVFSAGVDLVRVAQEGVDYLDEFLPALRAMFRTAFAFPKPLVGWIRGAAIAGGCVVASACDYRVAETRAKIGIPEMRVGVPFPTLGLEIMRFAANPSAFRQMVNSGATFIDQYAVAAGLVDEIVDDGGLDRCLAVANELAAVPADVFAHNKRHVRSPAWERIARGEQEFEVEVDRLWRSEHVRANIRDYVATKLNKPIVPPPQPNK